MEEADNILLITLKEMGIVGGDEDISGVAQLKGEHVYASAIACLSLVDPKKAEIFPKSMPRGMSVKVNICSDVANAIKGIGYKQELGYHQIMYPNAADTRKLLMWIVEKIQANQKSSIATASDGQVAKTTNLDEAISRELNSLLQSSWTPIFATTTQSKQYSRDSVLLSAKKVTYPHRGRKAKATLGMEKYYTKYLQHVTKQTKFSEEVPPSIFETNLSTVAEEKERENEWNTKGLDSKLNPMAYNKRKMENIGKMMAGYLRSTLNHIESENAQKINESSIASQVGHGSQFIRMKQYTTEEEVDVSEVNKLSEEELAKKRSDEIEVLQSQVSKIEGMKEELNKRMQALSSNQVQLEALINEEEGKTEKLEKEYLIKKRTFDLLPNAEKNILQLQEISSQASARIIDLAAEWEKYRTTLIEEYRKLKLVLANATEESRHKVEKIKATRQVMKEITDDIKTKEEHYRELLQDYGKLNKEIARNHYTDRIMDIVKNVKKQKVDIDKVLLEIRTLHKEINSTNGTLGRTFTEIDELVFQDAKKDPTAKDAYKYIVAMNEAFKKLIKIVEEVGFPSSRG
eukprot:TRINITY_DN5939_c1_g1_i1.p1 TRINITY_DN5939_c1_g1~~TRINITY_DN5939_c1_g1_i1.p1  ORF type:complete len:574 (+),score=233.64 TRINITY_DN5939_c1_g1_i1:140-1861(+)